MSNKVKINLENGQSYVIADLSVWEDLSYAISSIATQWDQGSEEYKMWMQFLEIFESQYIANLIEENYEEDGWI